VGRNGPKAALWVHPLSPVARTRGFAPRFERLEAARFPVQVNAVPAAGRSRGEPSLPRLAAEFGAPRDPKRFPERGLTQCFLSKDREGRHADTNERLGGAGA
jgi:hypothetical protein